MTISHCANFLAGRCGSCTLLALQKHGAADGIAAAAAAKAERLEQFIRRHLGPSMCIRPMFEPQTVLPSRAKAKLVVSGSTDEPVVGLLDDAYRGKELLDCPLHLPLLNRLLAGIKALIPRYKLTPYDVASRRGELKALILTTNRAQSAAMARFVLRSTEAVPRVRKACAELHAAHPELAVTSVNLQPLPAAVLEGPEELLLGDEQYLWEDYGCCRAALHPQCFMQVTPETAAALYSLAADRVRAASIKRVLDLFCGAGAFLLSCAGSIDEGQGLELSTAAIASANHAARAAGAAHLSFRSANVEEADALEGFSPDAVIVNPPRRGLLPAVRHTLRRLNPRMVLYSSCNPETLVRDLLELGDGFATIELAPFDMFPLTEHVEVLAVLERRVS